MGVDRSMVAVSDRHVGEDGAVGGSRCYLVAVGNDVVVGGAAAVGAPERAALSAVTTDGCWVGSVAVQGPQV